MCFPCPRSCAASRALLGHQAATFRHYPAIMTVLYEYRLSGRRPAIWLSGAAFVLMGTLMATYDAAPVVWVPVLIGAGMILWALICHPINGLRLTDESLILTPWTDPKSIPLDDIEAVQYTLWTDSEDMHVRLRSGRTVKVSGVDVPPISTFRAVLADIAIPVTET